jgi:60 kDa SS-A/Ro ribonucleoprotein
MTNATHNKLSRLVLANMMFEDQFYMDGVSNHELLKQTVAKSDPKFVQALANEARNTFNLRHVPLALLRELARVGKLEAKALTDVISRPDELGEFIAHYWKEGKQPLSGAVKRGLAGAFQKFNEYQFAKWDKNSASVRVRDVMFMTHPKPTSLEQTALFKKIADDALETPDTWETQLSSGADKRETFTRLMTENKLGALAFLRNLRNMHEAGVARGLIEAYSTTVNVSKVLPFRFIAAYRVVPHFGSMLEAMMFRSLAEVPKLTGETHLLVDASGSMFGAKVSKKSDLDRYDAAVALAILAREICENAVIWSFSNKLVRISSHLRGFDLIDAIQSSQRNLGTATGSAVRELSRYIGSKSVRTIIFTDEQANDRYGTKIPAPQGLGYVVNVGSYDCGITTNAWHNVTGFSEAVLDYIREYEKLDT